MNALARLLLSCVVTVHLVLAAAWWWLMPGGFPLSHPRFWVNRVLPPVVLALAGAYVWARYRRRDDVLRLLGLTIAAFWMAAAVSGRITFPITLNVLWLLPLLGAGAVAAVALRALRAGRKMPRAVTFAAVTLAGLAG